MEKKISFIHCADLHLDSPFKGMSTLPAHLYQELKRSTFDALDNLVALAINRNVDFILIVGDVFDESIQSVYAEMQFLMACQKLEQAGIEIYLSFGNHDYNQTKQRFVQFPDNVHLFDSDQVTSKVFEKDGEPLVAIHGFSYLERAVTINKTEQYQPVSNLPYQIAMLHGSIQQSKEHDHYAPFQLSDLINKPFDYWALGHIHKRSILSEDPPVVYSGNTQGRSVKELGEKGCYLVSLDQNKKAQVHFEALHAIQFDQLMIDVSHCQQIDQLYQLVTNHLVKLDKQRRIVFIKLLNYQDPLLSLYHQGKITDLVDVLNEQYQDQPDWLSIQQMTLTKQADSIDTTLEARDPFMKELLQGFDSIDWEEAMSELWHHRKARRFLDGLTEEEKQQIAEEAKQLLRFQLIGNDTYED
ncbi:metallophosphoesterase family protein [Amphibacillus cookii]|uniref:metallophosphoesterase family protein n=1 Tax=Amphibacillus cookii TaxID=767787 RepID=UPI00195EC115|nr:DNA repair exonuclease [Amphibacillus cookii]MBM7541515.1 DNA repair exonuclease SbcCD nuclease subunit [Amphibacillus cookii]